MKNTEAKESLSKLDRPEAKVKERIFLVGAFKDKGCKDKRCHIHGNLKIRGRVFTGKVIKKLPKRITIEFERMIYNRKYERYSKSRTRIHARLPDCLRENVDVGDLIRIQECRPLSKIIHFAVIGKIKDKEEK